MDEELDVRSRRSALKMIKDYKAEGKILTGLLHMDPDSQDLHELVGTVNKPLRSLNEQDLCPGNTALKNINASLK